jgi:MFS family permease
MSIADPAHFTRDRFTWLAYLLLGYYAYMQAALGPAMPFLRSDLDISYTIAGLHPSAFALGMVTSGLMADRLAHRLGRRQLLWSGALGMAGGSLGLVVARNVALTLTGALLMGFTGTLLLVMIQATLSDRHGENRAIALTESNIVAVLTATLAPLFVGSLQQARVGWQYAFLVGISALLLILWIFYRAAVPESRQADRNGEGIARPLPLLFWAFWVVIFLCVSVEWSTIFWGADFMIRVLTLSMTKAATLMSVFFMAMLAGRFTGSRMARSVSSQRLLLVALAISLAGLLVFWLARLAPVNILGLFVTGFGIANLFPLSMTVALSVVPEQSDIASARVTLGAGLAILIAPLFLGWAADQIDLQYAFGMAVVLLLAAVLVSAVAYRLADRIAGTGNV